MKIYAKQVPPEYQESPLFMGEWPDNVFVFGNRHFRGRGDDDIERIKNDMYKAADELKRLMLGEFADVVGGYSLKEILNDFVPAPEHKTEYSRADRLRWRSLLLAFDNGAISDDDPILTALQLSTGREYENATIRGCCQSDWQEIIYPTAYGREWLEQFETEYFNTGDEWCISENDPESDDNYYIYTHHWSDDGKRAEIAAAAGVDSSDVILYAFDGWSHTAKYKEVIL